MEEINCVDCLTLDYGECSSCSLYSKIKSLVNDPRATGKIEFVSTLHRKDIWRKKDTIVTELFISLQSEPDKVSEPYEISINDIVKERLLEIEEIKRRKENDHKI